MSKARLVAVTVERFKSYEKPERIELSPLTVIVGRNNGGKSTLLQSLLLLKQTLADPRSEVPLRLEGLVEAFSLRELTYGWPAPDGTIVGPTFEIEWESESDIDAALHAGRSPDRANLAKHTGIPWFKSPPKQARMRTGLRIETAESHGTSLLTRIELRSIDADHSARFVITRNKEEWVCHWRHEEQPATEITVEIEHFIPYLRINRSIGSRDRQRAWYNAYFILFAQPLRDLKRLLGNFRYLGSTRSPPPSLYKASTVSPEEIGVSGELAAQLLHKRQRDLVHYLPPIQVEGNTATAPEQVHARPLVDAVNEVLGALSVRTQVRVEEIQDVGFRLLFGKANFPHVGRGLTFLLPLIELGLFLDPMRTSGPTTDLSLDDYLSQCDAYAHMAIEEPEAHLHPKVQSRLAHWLVSQAMSNRQIMVETHSDHLVRRLRGLVARAGEGSALEQWLLANVTILEVSQDQEGRSAVTTSRLTAEGGVGEVWPEDFMDEASAEDSAIFYGGLAKKPPTEDLAGDFIHDQGPEPEVNA